MHNDPKKTWDLLPLPPRMREQPIRPNDCECGAAYSLDPRGVCIREAGSALWVDCGTCGRRTRTVNADKKTRQAAVRGIVREWNAGKFV